MSEPIKIQLGQLRTATDLLFKQLEDRGLKEICLDKDYYWEIDTGQYYDVTKKPTDLTIGSLYTDWEFVRGVASGENEPVSLNFLKIATLLRYLGDSVSEKDYAR